MIISRTPFRISFFGGGTDYPAWYQENGGSVIATTIDKYCYISCRPLPPFFAYKHRIVYSQVEAVNSIQEIRHPSVRAVASYLDYTDGLEIHHDGDLPARSGTGSSSAFTVGMINAMKALRGEIISKKDLATMAIHIEQKVIQESVGSQDQISAAYGGMNRIDFNPDGSFDVTPIILRRERRDELEGSLMLFFTGFSRTASDIAQSKIQNFKNKKSELTAIQGMTGEAISLLQSATTSTDGIGKLLHESWKLKRTLSEQVTTSEIDSIYEAGMRAGALGGKILGAGGGGFILFYVRPENQAKVLEQLKGLIHVNFNFETMGSKIVLYEPNF